jgi:transcriptional regulator with XRE-family HTH domain
MINRAIRVIRQFNGLTQTEVAERLSISKHGVSEIESGKKVPNVDLLEKFAVLYEMPVSSLVFFSETISCNDAKVPERFRSFASDSLLTMLEWHIERKTRNTSTLNIS